MTEQQLAEVFPPGEFLRDELEARGWSQTEFAEIIGRPTRLINEIIAGKRGITPETAKEFSAALGTSAQFWMNLETSYQLHKVQYSTENITRTAKLRERFPIREMIKRGWIEASSRSEVLESRVLSFFDIPSLESKLELSHAAKKNKETYDPGRISAIQYAWLYRVRQIAKSVSVPNYSESLLRDALPALQKLLVAPEEARHVPKILTECGVRFILVEPLPSAKIDGVCLWLDSDSPVIGMSLARDQIDHFWFVLRHEIEHILNRDGQKEGQMIDLDLTFQAADKMSSQPAEEQIANKEAANFCVPSDKLESFLLRKKPYYYEKDIVTFAEMNNIHPGLVVGQMQFRLNRYDFLKKYLVKIRRFITQGSIVDGWGQAAKI